ncbi:hypothetical protein ARMGADRAFT_1082312 [Armillaria gallica]|uniref:Uncharacterized protein n=1 Tax=Armillaria gallica TaxID=47427 RepID=A0A2H3DJT1_ARMGA|nr:hypothetical protein ARMGADRAFT_1082312 [Armillaria gallica]
MPSPETGNKSNPIHSGVSKPPDCDARLLGDIHSTVYGSREYGAEDLRKLMSATSHIQHLKSVDLTYKAGRGKAYRNLCMAVLETGYPVLTVRIPAKTALPTKMFVSRIRTDSDSDSDSDSDE